MRNALPKLLLLSLLFAAPLQGQERPVEIGMDGGLQILMPEEGDNATLIAFPAPLMRMGFYLSNTLAFEPMVALTRFSSDGSSMTSVEFQPNLVYYFREFERIPLPYVRAGAGVIYQGWNGPGADDSESLYNAGVGIGIKVPVAESAFLRFEGAFDHVFENDDRDGYNAVGLVVGISAVIN